VIRLDRFSKRIVWEYEGDPREAFFSGTRGGAEELRNGNVLIDEANRGCVFEVTPDGKRVWEFFNPDVDATSRATI